MLTSDVYGVLQTETLKHRALNWAVRRSHIIGCGKWGHNHGRALRGVCDRLITILMAILQRGKPYNPDFRVILLA
jgi:ketol-acid reductoisomerase